MYQRMRLWWQDPTDEELEDQESELVTLEYMRLLKLHAGNCPECGTALSIGIGDYTVGRTCDNCHYHDFSFLYPEIELADWKPSLLQRLKSWYNKNARQVSCKLTRALIKFTGREQT